MKPEEIFERRQRVGNAEMVMWVASVIGAIATVLVFINYGLVLGLICFLLSLIAYGLAQVIDILGDLLAALGESERSPEKKEKAKP